MKSIGCWWVFNPPYGLIEGKEKMVRPQDANYAKTANRTLRT